MEPQPTSAVPAGFTTRARNVVWVMVIVGAVAALAQVPLDWWFDTAAERLTDEHTAMLMRGRTPDSVDVWIWTTLPTAYYVVRLVLWVCAVIPTLACAALALRGSRAGRLTLLVLAALFAVVNAGYAVLYGISAPMRSDRMYGAEVSYPVWMVYLSVVAGVLCVAAAVALLVVLTRSPSLRRTKRSRPAQKTALVGSGE